MDETSDQKFSDYLGFCVATVNSYSYAGLKTDALAILKSVNWDPAVEFKGSYLFSASKGCVEVPIEERIKAAHALLDLNIALSNSRIRFYYGSMKSKNHGADYLEALPKLLGKLPKAPTGAKSGGGKNLLAAFFDERSDVDGTELHLAAERAFTSRGYVVVERVVQAASSPQTVGLMYADLVGYLAGRVDTISNDAGLLQDLTPEQVASNGKIRKLLSSQELIGKIKSMDVYKYETTP